MQTTILNSPKLIVIFKVKMTWIPSVNITSINMFVLHHKSRNKFGDFFCKMDIILIRRLCINLIFKQVNLGTESRQITTQDTICLFL